MNALVAEGRIGSLRPGSLQDGRDVVQLADSDLVRTSSMKETRQWERPDFEERPLGAEVTAYLGTAKQP